MRKTLSLVALVVWWVLSTQLAAQDCKPSVSREDRITKERVDIWSQQLSATSFMGSMATGAEVNITATVGRYGAANAINLQIQQSNESATNASMTSSYLGAKGQPMQFGFKNGEPLALVVTDVSNAANVQQGLITKAVNTVVLSAVLSDQEMGQLREALTSRQIDAVRIRLAGNQILDKAVSDGNGKKMREKFACFYQTLDKRGISLSPQGHPAGNPGVPGTGTVAAPQDLAKVAGKYFLKDKPSNYLDLNADGTFGLRQDGKDYSGTFALPGGAFVITQGGRTVPAGRFVGDNLVDPAGSVWERASEPKKGTGATLTIDQVVQMVGAKLSDEIIIAAIEKSGSKFDMSADNLIRLKTAGVSDAVLRAMMK